ncbi:MAG: hypothetical protein AAFV07_07445 [Bacteroidota bacterium]
MIQFYTLYLLAFIPIYLFTKAPFRNRLLSAQSIWLGLAMLLCVGVAIYHLNFTNDSPNLLLQYLLWLAMYAPLGDVMVSLKVCLVSIPILGVLPFFRHKKFFHLIPLAVFITHQTLHYLIPGSMYIRPGWGRYMLDPFPIWAIGLMGAVGVGLFSAAFVEFQQTAKDSKGIKGMGPKAFQK